MDKVAALRRCPLFADFTDVGLQIMATVAQPRRVPAGTPLFVEGMMGDSLLILVEGVVTISIEADGRERELATVDPGEALGELALLGPGPRLATATAMMECELLEIRRRDFAELQRKKPQACLKLLMAIVQRFGERLVQGRDAWRAVLVEAARR